ncbi:MAG: excinuclease ABC subunit UvrA [Coriobacteriales bacterium]|jgi:excinuclease ABC subunit A|nr:excinuclease ABC subunit UvrA [Coriobacteriales bacterium]
MSKDIIIKGAREGNLQNIDLVIPRDKLVVLTGLSGSGKTTLAIDLLFQECQRRYLEALGLVGIKKPDVDVIQNIAPAVMISQTTANRNPRSTVGTVTGIYTDLRMVFEKLHVRNCPACGASVSAAECKEEVEKSDDEFIGYMYCSHCSHRMVKLTSGWFSFNTRNGACPECQGIGQTLTVNPQTVVNQSLSLEAGAVSLWEITRNAQYMITSYYAALEHYRIPVAPNRPVVEFTDSQKAMLFYGVNSDQMHQLFPNASVPKTVVGGKFEGIYTALMRRISERGGEAKHLERYFIYANCPVCQGERLTADSRAATVAGRRLPELSELALDDLLVWVDNVEKTISQRESALSIDYLNDLKTKISRVINVGLEYLALDRQTLTLSGGESQRLKLAAVLDSQLSGIIYIFDEPTISLHPKDTHTLVESLKQLRDDGNSVIVIEHDIDVMLQADQIIDIGPGSGKHGGQIIGQGSLADLMKQPSSITGQYLLQEQQLPVAGKCRASGSFKVSGANLHNLKNLTVEFSSGLLTAVTGVSGSGKTSLVFDVLGTRYADDSDTEFDDEDKEDEQDQKQSTDSLTTETTSSLGTVSGLSQFDSIVRIKQTPLTRMKRSNVATYTDVWIEVRKSFASLPAAKEIGLTARHFSFNTTGGRCENCGGLGVIESHMLFFPSAEVVCPVCDGLRFNQDVLSVSYQGHSINAILKMPFEELPSIIAENSRIKRVCDLLSDVGLDYLELGQTLNTLSGGEAQRLKLVKELLTAKGSKTLYLMDEPTTGLHPIDVERFIRLLNQIVDAGSTVIVIEHNLQLLAAADWVIDLGPEGGLRGGETVFTGTPQAMVENSSSYTANELRRFLSRV